MQRKNGFLSVLFASSLVFGLLCFGLANERNINVKASASGSENEFTNGGVHLYN